MKRRPSKPSENSAFVIVLEDDVTTSQLLCLVLQKSGLSPIPCYSVREAHDIIQTEPRLSALIVDVTLPDGDGIDVIRYARNNHEGLPCFVLTVKNDVKYVVQAIKAGAENYLIKPFEAEQLLPTLIDAIKTYHGTHEIWNDNFTPPRNIRRWKSQKMREAMEVVATAANSSSPTMIIGAPYTGKSRLAELIHRGSKLKKRPMTTLNLAALSPLKIETELFGLPLEKLSEAPSFHKNKLAKCRGQILVIKNIQRLHPAAQKHLLAIIHEEQYLRKAKQPPCRIITTCPADLQLEGNDHEFNQELWHELAAYRINVPTLAERIEDLPLLCDEIITRLCITRRLKRPSLTRRAMERLQDHTWPGNLRELYNSIEYALSRTRDGLLGSEDFPPMYSAEDPEALDSFSVAASSIDDLTRASLIATLNACGGNRRRAAQRLKISLRTIYNMIERYELPKRKKSTAEELTEPSSTSL
jgi:DNA-binding NtrC family response regulator